MATNPLQKDCLTLFQMPIITGIKPQKNQKRVNIYLDGKFGFGLDLENFVKMGLKVEQELTEEEVDRIVKKAEFRKTLDKLLRFATLRPRSEREYRHWLKKHKTSESLHEELFNRLKRLELLDDKKFASWWIGQRIQFKFKSKKEIIGELRLKGISGDVIEDTLSEMKVDEIQMAKMILERKKYLWKSLGKFEARKKMKEFLARHGYSWNVIKNVLESDLID